MDIIKYAFDMALAVDRFMKKARSFFYVVMLVGHSCPKCRGALVMVEEGKCRCRSCCHEFDPTVEFQKCSNCDGVPELNVRRYSCRDCGEEITSRFLFQGIVYDAEYFRQRMVESRQRKKEQRERVKEILATCRSEDLMLKAMDLNSVPGLTDALNNLTCGKDEAIRIERESFFDLQRYQDHVGECLGSEPVELREMQPLIENLRLDLIWRFVAVIFLVHYGSIDILQEGDEILVMKHEVD